jgi:hypothetical protein
VSSASGSTTSAGELRQQRWWLIGLVIVGLLVRLPQLGASFYGDEAFSLFRDSEQLLTPTEDRFRFVFFSLLYVWKQLGFHGEVGLRLLPLLFGVLQIPVAFRLGALLSGPAGARALGVLIALNPLLIEFSQELRMYSLVPLLALLQALSLATLESRAAERRSLLPAWIGFVVAGTVGVYTHFHYWFLNAAFGLALLRRYRALPLRGSIAALLALGLLYLPNVPNLLRFQAEAASQPHLVATDLTGALPKLVAAFALGFNYFALPPMGIERTIGASILAANAALAVIALVPLLPIGWALLKRHLKRDFDPALWMAHELFTVPVLISLLAMVVMGRNFIHPKYMVFSAPFLQLFLLSGWLALRVVWLRWATLASGAAVFAIALWHFNRPQEYGRREDMRGLADTLRRQLGPAGVVLWLGYPGAPELMTRSPKPQSVWEYYGADLLPHVRVVGLPHPEATPAELAPVLARHTQGKREAYFVWSEIARNVYDPGDRVLTALRQQFGEEHRIQLNPRLVLYRYNAARLRP